MKILLAVLLFSLSGLTAYAQTDPKLSLFNYNPLVYNPAFAGSDGRLSIVGMHSSQFIGFEGAPTTQYLSLHALFEAHKIGAGLDVSNDQLGMEQTLIINTNFSYYLKISNTLKVSFGMKAGVRNVKMDYSGLNIHDPDEAVFAEGQLSQFSPNLGFGSYLYSENFYLGLSVPNIIQANRFDPFKVAVDTKWSNAYFTGGYNFSLGQDSYFKPAFLVRVVNGSPYSGLLSCLFEIKNKGFAGLNYEVDTALGCTVGVNISEKLKVGYAYDHPTNSLASYTRGTHSMFLSFNLDNFSKNALIAAHNH